MNLSFTPPWGCLFFIIGWTAVANSARGLIAPTWPYLAAAVSVLISTGTQFFWWPPFNDCANFMVRYGGAYDGSLHRRIQLLCTMAPARNLGRCIFQFRNDTSHLHYRALLHATLVMQKRQPNTVLDARHVTRAVSAITQGAAS